jgi:hypothetical protein
MVLAESTPVFTRDETRIGAVERVGDAIRRAWDLISGKY